jgi:hypothetical protein
LYLLSIYNFKKSVAPTDVFAMTKLTPTERLEWLRSSSANDVGATITQLLNQYEAFLEATDRKESVLIETFLNRDSGRSYMKAASEFGDTMFELLTQIGEQSRFYRILVV